MNGYDGNELILDVIEGELQYQEIAAKHGFSAEGLTDLLTGRSRPALKARLDMARESAAQAVRRVGMGHLMALFRAEAAASRKGDSRRARKCREFILDLAMDEDEGWRAAVEGGRQRKREADRARRLRARAKRLTRPVRADSPVPNSEPAGQSPSRSSSATGLPAPVERPRCDST